MNTRACDESPALFSFRQGSVRNLYGNPLSASVVLPASYSRPRCSRSIAFTAFLSVRSSAPCPPLKALPADAALPAVVVGPVEHFHGHQVRISAACRARRSGVQVVAMLHLQ